MNNLFSSGTTAAEVDAALSAFHTDFQNLVRQIQQRVVGHADIVADTVAALLARGHVLLEGAPGLGKTLLVRTLAECLDLSFARIQFTPDLMPADIIGTTVMSETHGPSRFTLQFQEGPLFTHVLLADEINRGTPKTQSALLEAMQEGAVTVGRERRVLPRPFFVLATQNPIEMEGTYPLPEAELDRFLFKLLVASPSAEELHEILDRTTGITPQWTGERLTEGRLHQLSQLVRELPVARPVKDYVVRLVQATHPERSAVADWARWVRYGASPRGAQALLLGAKIKALRRGSPSASFADVRATVPAALRHRLILTFEGDAHTASVDQLLAEVVKATPELL
jgi:MoxR-like ATPase